MNKIISNNINIKRLSFGHKIKHQIELAIMELQFKKKSKNGFHCTSIVNNLSWKLAKEGIIKKKYKCEFCNKKNCDIEGHHPSYLRPLVIFWLCRSCHRQEHSRLKRNGIDLYKEFYAKNHELPPLQSYLNRLRPIDNRAPALFC